MRSFKEIFSRILLSTVSACYSAETDTVPTPDTYKIFLDGNIPEKIEKELIKSYQEIFREEPWNEEWNKEQVARKIKKDLIGEDTFLIVIEEESKVKGFAWGAVIHQKQMAKRAAGAMNVEEESFSSIVVSKDNAKLLYCDELALLKEARRGIDPVRHLVKKILEYGLSKGVTATAFWSTPSSKIVPIAQMMGYHNCGGGKVKDKEIIFLLNQNFISLLKITKNLKSKHANIFMAFQRKKKQGPE